MLLDVNLPDATGWDVLRAFFVTPAANYRVIVMSAVPQTRRRYREFKPIGILHKPFPIEALLRLIGSACAECVRAAGPGLSAICTGAVRVRHRGWVRPARKKVWSCNSSSARLQ